MKTKNTTLDFSQLKLAPNDISTKLKSEIDSICQEISDERATKFEADITSFVETNPEYHWTLLFCRQCHEKFLENAQPENDSDYDKMVYLFTFSDIEKINEFATIDNIDLNALDQIDFVFNTNLSVWVSDGYAPVTFLDATFHKWDLEKKLVKKDRETEVIYLQNVVLTIICRNFAELTSKYDLNGKQFATIIWTILENGISSCENEAFFRTYFNEDSDRDLVIDSVYFYFEHLLHFDLENEFNSEIDTNFSQFQGYRTDFIALSETLLEMDLFDL